MNPTSKSILPEDGDINIVQMWLTFDLPRLIAGLMAGLFAGAVAMTVAGLLSSTHGSEFWFPIKAAASPILGRDAMSFGMHPVAILVGFAVEGILFGVLGMTYAHFTKTNYLPALLGAGFMWGTFSWVFINNLFSHSFLEIRELDIGAGVMMLIFLIFGFSLVSVRFFDRLICGKAR